MQILSVHNRYQFRGGEDVVFESEDALLREHGHQIVNYIQDNKEITDGSKWKVAARTIWSAGDYRAIRELLREKRPDVLAVHNFFPLISPAVYYAAQAERVPVVQTLHNFRLLCPNGLFYRNGAVCEDCLGKTLPWPGVLHGCYKGSKAGSVAVSAMISTHRAINTWSRMVDVYIALTEFCKRKFIEGGLPAEKIVVKPNFVYPDPGTGTGGGNFALFVGRLSPEKGLDTLLEAWKHLGSRIPLKILGDGPMADQLAKAVEGLEGVEWLKRRPSSEVYHLMGEAAFVLFPSRWYETFGRIAIEAFAKGTPVIASDIGAVAELVEPGRTGLRFRPGDPASLIEQVEWMLSHPLERERMRQEARAEFERKYTAEKNYEILMSIYERAKRRLSASRN